MCVETLQCPKYMTHLITNPLLLCLNDGATDVVQHVLSPGHEFKCESNKKMVQKEKI